MYVYEETYTQKRTRAVPRGAQWKTRWQCHVSFNVIQEWKIKVKYEMSLKTVIASDYATLSVEKFTEYDEYFIEFFESFWGLFFGLRSLNEAWIVII